MTTTTCASGWKSYRVALRKEEGRGMISLFLKPSDDSFPPNFTAGQYVNLRLPDMTSRAYFLTGLTKIDSFASPLKLVTNPTLERWATLVNFVLTMRFSSQRPLATLRWNPAKRLSSSSPKGSVALPRQPS